MRKPSDGQGPVWQGFHGPNLGYVIEMYEAYLENPDSVDEEIKAYFAENGPPTLEKSEIAHSQTNVIQVSTPIEKILAAANLADKVRGYGHLAADIYPLKNQEPDKELIEMDYYGLTKQDLEEIPAHFISTDIPHHLKNGYEAIEYLKKVYTGKIAFEIRHVNNNQEKMWIRNKIESGSLLPSLTADKKKKLLQRLTEVEEFEKFIHKTFVGQKRFSIEGLDTLVPLIDEIILETVENGASTINIGMAHRGRLNVLAHNLGKPYEMIFAEFQHAPNKELVPSEGSIGINFGWTGDVKYHLGLNRELPEKNQRKARITLANNPSHLEFVGAVVEGFTRAAQDDRTDKGYPKEDLSSALAILVHGDAAFPGQGIVAETLNLSRLKGYRTGGTIHVIANNLIGFTTERMDSRSTRYSSDLAKGYEMPILHVNADDPEAVLAAAQFACEYRETFKKDVLIDLVGYRRFGHNEMDEPMTTNPLMYQLIQKHPTVKELYAQKLLQENILSQGELEQLEREVLTRLQEAYAKVPEKEEKEGDPKPPETVEKGISKMKTGVPLEKLKKMNEELLQWPEGFQVFSKLSRILKRRLDAFKDNGKVDWGLAETLAFASIIADGTPVRLSGQDSERGTFAHRNIVLYDQNTGEKFSPLHRLSDAKASFSVYNSPLSEGSVLGFEYGYNVFAPETLVLWEAQFGDFSNAAQVIFDQFISSGRAKWGEKSGLVILLPHGYEGQGPEHSSARMERFLTLAAENNWTVANLTSAAQYFHILRRQAAILNKEEVRPLVIMTPKSLLRNPRVASHPSALSEGEFHSIIEHKAIGQEADKVERVVLGTGKMVINLLEQLDTVENTEWLHVVSVEEIYPFPMESLKMVLDSLPNVKEIVWVQEEPKNMGAWTFVEPRIKEIAASDIEVRYVGRRRRSSPAEGDPDVHKMEQACIIDKVITRF
ncbi:2-oxoglutarate dehydrogenase E1 component [Robertmurraya sp. DFI.2.37]|uniref:2-oxoglutarate dehydrogenase E1 component n=1 Tax=Robertmurraya sp. DFI.2.37 TaxID=3031819 RepID=UPI001245C3A2|nr:2-oxoglutarate dehydrogenase E1 component [Robertmurraya sp. DFI.2.37]MDF1509848.1 2-oxoglutarate dehydrogenase E1 component [Robertmurraya sp. DFI.2.37]